MGKTEGESTGKDNLNGDQREDPETQDNGNLQESIRVTLAMGDMESDEPSPLTRQDFQ